MDLTRGFPSPSPRPRSCLAIRRFRAASYGLAEDDERDLREARARPRRRRRCPAQDEQDLSTSPVPWTATTGIVARSSVPPTMIVHRTRRLTLSLCFFFSFQVMIALL